MAYPIREISIALGLSPATHPFIIEYLLLDSRRVHAPSASLFFALKGPRRDGHQFITELYKKDVRNFVVSEAIDTSIYPGANFLQVPDTLEALQRLAAWHREKFPLKVIGITGSNGKTIVKEWLYQLLQSKETIVRSPKSFNSQIGVPLSIWQINAHHTLGIFEAGISMPGEMEKLESIVHPQIGVLTNIGDAHSEGFRNNEEKFLEKAKLFKHADWIVCHSKDDPGRVLKNNSITEAMVQYCGHHEDDQLQILSVKKAQRQSTITARFNIEGRKKNTFVFSIPFTDDASIENAVLCLGVASLFVPVINDIDELRHFAERMSALEPVEMRMQLKKGINNCTIINDSYSNDLSSLGIALDYLKQQSGAHPTTAIISDILESGISEPELYAQVAAAIRNRQIQRVICIGAKLSAQYQLFSNVAGETSFYLSTEEFLKEASSHQFREHFILLKGARLFAFERISNWLEQKVHQTLLEINLNAIAHNLKVYQQLLQPSTKVMAMVKAFAYGSGGAEIAGILQYHKVDYLGVAYVDEGVELRRAGITLPIMVMNPEENSFDALVDHNLEPEIYSFALLHAFEAFAEKEGLSSYPVHIEIETGMNRLGFSATDSMRLGEHLANNGLLKVQSIFSHLAASEDPAQDAFTMEQYQVFEDASRTISNHLSYKPLRHIANSAAIARHPSLQLDMVRLGIGMYGIDSAGLHKLNLQAAATLRTTVAQIKHLKTGESVSYNRRSIVKRDSIIATVRLGYADGYPRRLGNGIGSMYIGGKMAPVIGTVCMDMVMLDITDIPGIKEGDDVIVFGKQLPVQQVATWAGTIPYEIMTGISQRVKRVYFEE
jgi:alanine racemase